MYYARPQQAGIVRADRSSPRAANHNEECSEQVEVTLAPYSGRSNENESCDAHAKEVVASKKRDGPKWQPEPEGERERVRGEERAQRRRDDGDETENEEYEIPPPSRPVLYL